MKILLCNVGEQTLWNKLIRRESLLIKSMKKFCSILRSALIFQRIRIFNIFPYEKKKKLKINFHISSLKFDYFLIFILLYIFRMNFRKWWRSGFPTLLKIMWNYARKSKKLILFNWRSKSCWEFSMSFHLTLRNK